MSAPFVARVASPPPGMTVVAASLSPERRPVRGYPAHPAGRAPVRDDRCIVVLDENDRLFITSWESA